MGRVVRMLQGRHLTVSPARYQALQLAVRSPSPPSRSSCAEGFGSPGSTTGVCTKEEGYATIAKAINRVHGDVPEVICVIENMVSWAIFSKHDLHLPHHCVSSLSLLRFSHLTHPGLCYVS